MSGSGKGLLGMWLYRRGEEWAVKEGSPMHKSHEVSNSLQFMICEERRKNYSTLFFPGKEKKANIYIHVINSHSL